MCYLKDSRSLQPGIVIEGGILQLASLLELSCNADTFVSCFLPMLFEGGKGAGQVSPDNAAG